MNNKDLTDRAVIIIQNCRLNLQRQEHEYVNSCGTSQINFQ